MNRGQPVRRELRQSEDAFPAQFALRVEDLDAQPRCGGPRAHKEIGASLRKRREVDCHVAGFPDVRHGGAVEYERLDPIAVIEVALDDGARRIAIGGVYRQQYDSLRTLNWPRGLWSGSANLSVHLWSECKKGHRSEQEFAKSHLRFNLRVAAMVHRNDKAAEYGTSAALS
jgi:hypothetical protein